MSLFQNQESLKRLEIYNKSHQRNKPFLENYEFFSGKKKQRKDMVVCTFRIGFLFLHETVLSIICPCLASQPAHSI